MKKRYIVTLATSTLLLVLTMTACSKPTTTNTPNQESRELTKAPPSLAPTSALPETSKTVTSKPSKPPSPVAKEVKFSDFKNALFAYSNEKGDKLITIGENIGGQNPQIFNVAVGENGKQIDIHYKELQKPKSINPNQNAYNFDKNQGHIYLVDTTLLLPNTSYILLQKKEFPGDVFAKFKNTDPKEELDKNILDRFKSKYSREVKKAWNIAENEDGTKIHFVLYQQKDKDALAALVLSTKTGMVYKSLPATYDNGSAWRVDDGGEIGPQQFGILFAAKTSEGAVLAVTWDGVEGQNIMLLTEKNTDFIEALMGSRYWGAM